MKAGDLRHRVTIQRPRGDNDIRDAVGQPVDDWYDVDSIWAAIEPLSSRESFAARQAQSTVTHRIRMRYCGATSQIESTHRLKYVDPGTNRTRYFYFDGMPTSSEERRDELIGIAQERGA